MQEIHAILIYASKRDQELFARIFNFLGIFLFIFSFLFFLIVCGFSLFRRGKPKLLFDVVN